MPELPPLEISLLRGALGGVAMSLGGFAPWALAGRRLYRAVGEAGLYGLCAVAFVLLGGLTLHRLLIGRRTLGRFYGVFGVSFGVYSVAWIAGWMAFRGHPGSLAGLAAGAMAMAAVLVAIFGTGKRWAIVAAALFLPTAAGYFLGGVVEGHFMPTATTPAGRSGAMLLWGVGFGLGFGSGLALALHFCQREVLRAWAEQGRQRVIAAKGGNA